MKLALASVLFGRQFIMKSIQTICIAAALAAISACGSSGQGNTSASANSTANTQTAKVYSGSGTIKAIAGNQVSIAHGAIAGIGWPPMTMTFTATPAMEAGVKVGTPVNFSFRKDGSAYALTSLKPR